MKNELLSLLSFAIGIAAYTVSQLQMFGKLRWSKEPQDFWGEDSWYNKYKSDPTNNRYGMTPAKVNWYTRLFNIKYKERWFTSTNFTVFLTDGYHFCQFLFFLFISLSVVPILGWTYGIAFWILAHVIHFLLHRTLQR